jgi:CheY-like chemotaxis protein
VFLNLVINASHAIREGDIEHNRITIRTNLHSTGQVAVEIGDTGTGIPSENLERIFDAFYTTKPKGVGTGLGLSICHRIVADLGGSIEVTSRVGQGTTFRVLLPASSADGDSVKWLVQERPATRRGRILVIDDEPTIQRVVQRMLSREHEVVTLSDAQEALSRLLGGEHFDVIFCDLMMPQMTGIDLYLELARVLPAQIARIVFLTGGAFTPQARAFLDEVPNPRIEKPFKLEHLRAVVNDRLQER